MGMLYYFWNKKRRLISQDNVSRAIARGGISTILTPDRIVRESCKNLGCMVMELIKVYYGMGGGLLNSIKIDGLENYDRARATGRGVMFVTGHCGNWELLALAVGKRVGRVGVVGRPQKNPYLYAIIEHTRERFGNFAIDKRGALRAMLRTLKEGGAIGVLMDQAVIPDEGYVLNFLGAPAWVMKTPAIIAKRAGACVLPAFIKREGSSHRITIFPEVQMTGNDLADTKAMNLCVEDYVRANPTEWLWIHRRWKRTEGLTPL